MNRELIVNLAYMVPLALGIFIYYLRKHRKDKALLTVDHHSKVNSDGEEFLNKLDLLQYFEFTPSDKLDILKSEVKKCYENYGEIGTLESDGQYVCHRLYGADEESLFEEGGILDQLNVLKHSFEKRNLRFHINDHYEYYEENIGNQWVVINNRKYVIYEELEGSKSDWSYATDKLIDLLNKELHLQGSNEKFYRINGGNDAKLIFIRPELYEFLSKSALNEQWKPRI